MLECAQKLRLSKYSNTLCLSSSPYVPLLSHNFPTSKKQTSNNRALTTTSQASPTISRRKSVTRSTQLTLLYEMHLSCNSLIPQVRFLASGCVKRFHSILSYLFYVMSKNSYEQLPFYLIFGSHTLCSRFDPFSLVLSSSPPRLPLSHLHASETAFTPVSAMRKHGLFQT